MDQGREARETLEQLRCDAHRIAERFGLAYKGIAAEHPRVRSRYGACYEDGLIKIRLRHVRTGDLLKYSSLVDTLCHELAHVRHFNHGPEFKALYLQLLSWARREGVYQPGPRHRRCDRTPPLVAVSNPPRRNGVPIFPEPPSAADDEPPPWERSRPPRADGSPARPAVARVRPPRPAPAPAREPARSAEEQQPSRPVQLSLF